jgi:starch synthase
MKIALFTNEFPPNIYGGAAVHIDFLSQALAKFAKVEVRCFGNQDEHKKTVSFLDETVLKLFHCNVIVYFLALQVI